MSADARIQELVATKLAGRKIDVVGFVDALLEMASEFGEIHCSASAENALRFVVPDATPFQVEVDGATGKLRMLCARLAHLCAETNSSALSPYSGVGRIQTQVDNGSPRAWNVRFTNTTSTAEFAIAPTKIDAPTAGVRA